MTQYVLINTPNTPGSSTEEFLNNGDSIYVAPNVVLSDQDDLTSNSFAIHFDFSGTAQIYGAVVGAQAVVFAGAVASTSTVQIGAAGSVTSTATTTTAFGAVTVQTGHYAINNAGLIEALADGVDLDFNGKTSVNGIGGGTLANSGAIDSAGASGVFNADANAVTDTLVNSGTISAEHGVAVFDTGGHAVTIENSGRIVTTGGNAAIFGAAGAEAVDNSGVIDGSVVLTGAGSSLTNSGAINGDVVFATPEFRRDGKIVATQVAAGGSTNDAILVSGLGALENRGTIDGEYNGVVNNDANAGDIAFLNNYGSIAGGVTAVQDTGGHAGVVHNYGEMSGGLEAYLSDSNSIVRLFNAGTMNGAVGLFASGSSLANSGAINGLVYLDGAYRLVNDGTIVSSGGDGVQLNFAFNGAGALVNHGKIDAANSGVVDEDTFSADVETLDNYGSISAGANAVYEAGSHTANVFNFGDLNAGVGFDAVFGGSGTIVALHNAGVINGAVELGAAGSSLTDSGAINGDVRLAGGGGATDVVISKTGVLTGNPGDDTLTISTGAYDIVNAGQIVATQAAAGGSSNAAVQVSGAGRLVNRGAIDGEFNGFVNNDANAGDVAILVNYGSIMAGAVSTAAQDNGGHNAVVVNYGVMSGFTVYFADSSTVVALTNAGAMTGSVSLNGANSSLTNSGVIDGEVDLNGGGAHVFNTGSIHGAVVFSGTGNVYNGVGGTVTDTIFGSGADGVYYAGDGVETFDFSGSGANYVRGGTGDDTFVFGATLTAATRVVGGAGLDTVEFAGAYTGASALTLTALTLRNIATLKLDAGFSYAITANAFTVAAGQTMTVDASALAAANNVSFNASNAQTGSYALIGGAGADVFTFKAANLLATDTVTGGAGAALDTLRFSTAGSIAAGAFANVSGIEHIALANGANTIQLTDALVASANGHTVTVFGGTGADTINASLVTTATNRVALIGGAGADTLVGGGSQDFFEYTAVSQSTGPTYDTVQNVNFTTDRFILPSGHVAIGAIDAAVTTGALSTATFNANLAAAIGATKLLAHDAVLFTASSGTLAGDTFLVVDLNGTKGFQAGGDLVMRLVGQTGALTKADFI